MAEIIISYAICGGILDPASGELESIGPGTSLPGSVADGTRLTYRVNPT